MIVEALIPSAFIIILRLRFPNFLKSNAPSRSNASEQDKIDGVEWMDGQRESSSRAIGRRQVSDRIPTTTYRIAAALVSNSSTSGLFLAFYKTYVVSRDKKGSQAL